MNFKKYLRKNFGSIRDYKKSFINESEHFKHDWIKFMNYQKECYLKLKNIEEKSKFSYMMLSRLQSDCEYFLNHGNGCEKHLYYNNIDEHIAEMKKLYNSIHSQLKPEWLTFEEIESYSVKMKNMI